MSRVKISAPQQIERIQQMNQHLDDLLSSSAQLNLRPRPKSWSIIEVIEHMNIAHHFYIEKIDSHLKMAPPSTNQTDHTAHAMPSFLMKRFPPKDGKIKFKMKTFKRFTPVFDLENISENKIQTVIKDFRSSLEHLEKAIQEYTSKITEQKRFASAVGAWVKFNVPEAIEFIICHNERHWQQIWNTQKDLAN